MSFFEKMMRINENRSESIFLERQSRELFFEEEPTGDVELQFCQVSDVEFKKKEKGKARGNLDVLDEGEEQAEWEQICDEPKVQLVYRQPKPKLMVQLLSKKQQLLQNMLARKRQFETKALEQSILHKEVMQASCSSSKHKNEKSRTSNSQYISNGGVKLMESKVSMLQSLKSPTNRMFSVSKQNECLQDKQSRYSSQLNQQAKKAKQIASQNENVNKEIVMRLLNILENDRQDRNHLISLSNTGESGSKHKENRQKDHPIIINNILKTPMETLNRDIIERQMKIKILENNRYMRNQFSHPRKSNCPQNSKQRAEVSDLLEREKESLSQVAANTQVDTRRSQKEKQQMPSNTEQSLERKQSLSSNVKASVQNSRITTKTELNDLPIRKVSLKINTPADQLLSSGVKGEHGRSTNYNSQQNSEIRKQTKNNRQRVRQFDLERRGHFKDVKNNTELTAQNIEGDCKNNVVQIKPPVFIEIPVDGSKDNQGLTLAQAFKRKIGRLKSEKQREQKQNVSPLKTNRLVSNKMTAPSVSGLHQFSLTLTDQLAENKAEGSTDARHLNRRNEKVQSSKKSSIARSTKVHQPKKEEEKNSGEVSRQPSKQLIDRLIYGQRAKVSKAEMYALTRKNYENLPEVKAKKKEQENRKLELQRLAKLKEYQRQIRSTKSLKKE